MTGPVDLTRDQFARWWRETGERELRQVLYWRWDPIGVSDQFPIAADEYDDYGPGVVALLRAGASEEDVADHLAFVERETIGVVEEPERCAEVAALLAIWFEGSVDLWQRREPRLTRVQVAHADAWEAEGRLRASRGGGALAVRGLRLMASGLPHAQWNSGDVTAPDADLAAARAFYAERGADWGVRVPAGMAWAHGRRVLTLRLMALEPAAFRPAPAPSGVAVRAATRADLDAVLAVDAAAFGADPDVERAWLEPHLDAPAVTTALATLDEEPAGTGYGIATDGRAGPALYLAGVAVRADARRRGVGAALSSWLVARGLRAGARLAHLHADTDGAARVYARLGFADTTGLEVYVGL